MTGRHRALRSLLWRPRAALAATRARAYAGEHRLLEAALTGSPPVEAGEAGEAGEVVEVVEVDVPALVPADLSPRPEPRHLAVVPVDEAAQARARLAPAYAAWDGADLTEDLGDTAPHPIVRLFPLPVEDPAVVLPGDPAAEDETTVLRFVARG